MAKQKLRLKALAHAKSQVGVMEHGGNNQGAKVLRFIRKNGGTGPEPWCGDFMAWCYRRAGSKVVQRGWAAVRFIGYMTGMGIVRRPRAGDLVCFTFDHVGMFVTYCTRTGLPAARKHATHIRTIEGNTGASGAVSDSSTGGDGVYVKIRPLSQVARFVRVYR